ncbi:protein of unknown function [Candidatus Nitrosacidococcus tergens]|uniref:Uncharacterized protein n=1 Tax=Candidatus Nitrosacidococcus tergens TaxID=553981 RepID=A0A7G1QCB8_9GAMM|nr:protein of unknown function [Candidatus Nitrosacidococcus tergens]
MIDLRKGFLVLLTMEYSPYHSLPWPRPSLMRRAICASENEDFSYNESPVCFFTALLDL